jgi:hypothetical protein
LNYGSFRNLQRIVACSALSIACAQGERPPAAPVRDTLALDGGRARAASDAPFAVVFAAPKGKATSAAEISVVFNRPVRSLEVAGAAPVPPITIAPPIDGKWLWVGSRALRFVPASDRLTPASHYVVEIPASVRSLDGATLAAPYRVEFETPRPAVVSTAPYAGEDGLDLGARFELEMNQRVDPARFERAVKLYAETGTKRTGLTYVATRFDPRLPKKLLVTPRSPLPKDSSIVLEVTSALVGEEGPLPSGETKTYRYRTYGPLRVEQVSCDTDSPHGRCAPSSSVGLTLTNPVTWKALRAAVSIDPPVPLHLGDGEDSESTSYVNLGGLAAGATYKVTLAPDLVDRYGQTLGKPEVRVVKMDDYFPAVDLGVTGDTLLPASAGAIQVGAVNYASYDLLTASLRPEDVPRLLEKSDATERLARLGKLPYVKVRTVSARGPKNRVVKEPVDAKTILGGDRGVLALGARYTHDAHDYHSSDPFHVLKVTDLAVSAKLSRHGSVVWVTRLASGEPVPNAAVDIVRPKGDALHFTTDAMGLATIPETAFAPNLTPGPDDAPSYVFVRSGNDWTYENIDDHLPEWRLPVWVDLSGTQHTYGMLFTERGIYRPGDVVKLKGIVRNETPKGNSTPVGRDVLLTLRSPDGQEVSRAKARTSRFGTFASEFTVPLSASLGGFQIRADLGEGDTADADFELAEYRPAEFKVGVDSAEPAYLRGATSRFAVHGDYLFGSPMAGAAVHYSVSRGQTSFQIPGSDGFATEASTYYADLPERALAAGEIASGDAKLDATGAFTVATKLELPGQRGPEIVRVDAEVTDASRQAIAGGASAVVHPADFYVGVATPDDMIVAAPSDLTPRVVAFTPDGKRVAGKAVHVELLERRWTLAREQLANGRSHAVTKVVDRVAGACDVVTGAPGGCTLHVAASGYHVVVARAKDPHGRVAEAAYGLYAGGESGGSGYGDDDRARLDLVVGKKEYKPGETATILVKSPFAKAEALVTVERAGVYRAQRVTLKGSSPTVTVPITDDLRPNAFVSVHLLRAVGAKPTADPLYRVGYAELAIDPKSRRLSVDVKPSKTELSPGDDVTIDVTTLGVGGKPAKTELAVYAVDEGVLMLTGYRTPDPLPVFTAARPLSVATLETRESMAKISLADFEASLGQEKGGTGGGGGGEGSGRRDFRQTAYFNPSVLTDDAGRARVTFKLPDGLTTYRVMAVATTEGDQYGFGSANVVTSRRLMARPALPRFVRAGDRIDAGIVVSTKGLPASHVTVKATVKGLVLDGANERAVDVPSGQSVEVRFPMHAEQVGDASLRFDVSAGADRDSVVVTRKVEAPGSAETVAVYGSTESAVTERLGDYSAIRHDTGGLSLSLSSSALAGLDGAAAQLTEYEYECTEQLSSRVLPLLPLRELSTAFGFALPRDTDAVVGRALGAILARQRGDGGFAMWPEATASNRWVSTYATWVLDRAAAFRAVIPKAARDRAHAYLRAELAHLEADPGSLAAGAFAVDVLAEAGTPDAGYMTRLFDARRTLPLFARAYLLHAMAVGKGPPASVGALATELASELRIANDSAFVAENVGDEYAVLLDSPARSDALVLRALLAVDPKHALGAPLARGLLAQRRGGTWRTTQETAYALLALDAYRRAQEARPADFVAKAWLGGSLVRTATFGKSLLTDHSAVELARLPGGKDAALVVEKQGSGTLFYEARLRYVRTTLPSTPLDEGFTIEKALRPTNPAGLDAALRVIPEKTAQRFHAGDLVIADLVIAAPSPRDYVVIDDPLPAGFEGVDSGLATSASWLDPSASPPDEQGGEGTDCDGCETERDRVAQGTAFQNSWYRREVRDDRILFFVDHMPAGMYHYRYLARATTAGTFVLPPTKVEEMYTPETFGRTGADTVVVE